MITSKDNQLVKYVKSLTQKKYREKNLEYIVEGTKMVVEAIENNEDISKIIICNEIISILDNGEKINKILSHQSLTNKIEYVNKSIFEYISETVTPQGIIAIVKQKRIIDKEYSDIIFALDDLQDPGNLGTIIRTLDAAGYRDLILSNGTAEAHNPKVVRSTMGAIFRLKLHINTNLEQKLIELKSKGYKVVITSLETNNFYYDVDFKEKLVIVIGNESKGVSKEIQDLADIKVKIPMIGKTESLNAAVATSIIAYEGVRQKFTR